VAEPSPRYEGILWEVRPGGVTVLLASSCPKCARTEFPGVNTCAVCGTATSPAALGPEATLRGLTEVLHQPPDAKIAIPYTVVVAAFEDAQIAVIGPLETYTPSAALRLRGRGARLQVCSLGYAGGSSYAFRLV
jgi:uncharacterized OB-fold protein